MGEGEASGVAQSCQVGCGDAFLVWGTSHNAVDLSSNGAFEAANYLSCGFTFTDPSLKVGLGAAIALDSYEDDTMQCRVSTAVPAPIEAVTGGFTGGGGNGRYPAQGGERGLGSHPVRVAPDGDDQLRSHDGAHPVHGQQVRVMDVEGCEHLVFQHLGTLTGINMSLGKMF